MRVSLSISALLAASAITATEAFAVTPAPTTGAATRIATSLSMARRPGGGGRRGAPVQEKKPPMNEEITATELRVTTPNEKGVGKDTLLGVMSLTEALAKAKEMGDLDLIMMNEHSDPPVCKIADWSKYRYMQEKKAKELKKNSKATEIKEVKMSYKIDVHDYGVRMKNSLKFLQQGNRVKATVMFRGREVQHDKLGFELLDKMAADLEEYATKEGRPKREGRNLSLILSPKNEVMKAISDRRRAEEKAKKKNKKEAFESKLAAKESAAVTAGVTAEGLNGESEDTIIDMESSLDDLLGGGDDLTDDIFS